MSGAHRPSLKPRYPSRRGFFAPSGTFVNLEGWVATRKHLCPHFASATLASFGLTSRRGFSLLRTPLVFRLDFKGDRAGD